MRLSLAIACGNALGFAAFRLALWLAPQWWAAAGRPISFAAMILLIALTAMAFGAPPVIIGAAAARFAARYEPYVGLASAGWAASARHWWPADRLPLLPPESWLLPVVLILLSGLIGDWVAGVRPLPEAAPRPNEA